MTNKQLGRSIALTSGSALALSMAMSAAVQAQANPFQATDLGGGYMQLAEAKCGEGKCGEGKCGGSKAKASEHKCGEGKCGEAGKRMDRMIGK